MASSITNAAVGQSPAERTNTYGIAHAHVISLAVSDESLATANAKFAVGDWFARGWLACVFQHEFDVTDLEASFIEAIILDDYQSSDAAVLHVLAAQLVRFRGDGVIERALARVAADDTYENIGDWDDLSGYLRCFAYVPLAALPEQECISVSAFWDALPVTSPRFAAALDIWLSGSDTYSADPVAVMIERLLVLGATGVAIAAAWLVSESAKQTQPPYMIGALERLAATTGPLDDVELRILNVLAAESVLPFDELIAAARTLAADAR